MESLTIESVISELKSSLSSLPDYTLEQVSEYYVEVKRGEVPVFLIFVTSTNIMVMISVLYEDREETVWEPYGRSLASIDELVTMIGELVKIIEEVSCPSKYGPYDCLD